MNNQIEKRKVRFDLIKTKQDEEKRIKLVRKMLEEVWK